MQRAERMLRRSMPARAVLTQMPPLQSRVAQHAREGIQGAGISLLRSEVIQRAAYQSMPFTGTTPAGPGGDSKAAAEVCSVLNEFLAILAAQRDWAGQQGAGR